MDGAIPSTYDGQIVALADKLDTLRECFRIGLAPTGSKDPFALRRAAQGVVKILVEAKFAYKLDDLATDELREFLLDRIKYYFRDVRGFAYDEVNAVLASGVTTLENVEARLEWLAKVRPTQDFEPLAVSFKRINNILKQANVASDGEIHAELLEDGPEQDLYNAYCQVGMFDSLADSIASLRPQLDRFFDKVMVNVPDAGVRTNRLTLLHKLLSKVSTVADFSEIVTSGDQK